MLVNSVCYNSVCSASVAVAANRAAIFSVLSQVPTTVVANASGCLPPSYADADPFPFANPFLVSSPKDATGFGSYATRATYACSPDGSDYCGLFVPSTLAPDGGSTNGAGSDDLTDGIGIGYGTRGFALGLSLP